MTDQNNPQIGLDQGFENYINGLIEERKFPNLTPELKEEMKKDLRRRLDDFIAARVIAGLSDKDVLVFEEMLKEKKPQEEIQKFVSTNIPDFTNFLTNVLLEFKGIYIGKINAPIMSSPSSSLTPLSPAPAPVGEKKMN